MLDGLISLPWWGYLLVLLALTHGTIVSVTIYLHRAQAHRSLQLHPALGHLFRFWLWLTTGMVTREWIAIHRKHHAHCDSDGDPHSPQLLGISQVLWQGAELYRQASQDQDLLQRFGQGAPDDWIERHLYSRHPSLGIVLMLAIDLLCFGAIGLTLWALQMIWIPFFAAGVINGVGHWCGYRNFEIADASRNLVPFAVLIGGEELHNNHHAAPTSPRLSCRWYELDIGWCYIRLLAWLRLVRIRQAGLLPRLAQGLDPQTWSSRLHVLSVYGREVVLPTVRQECQGATRAHRRLLRRARWLLLREKRKMSEVQRRCLERSLSLSERLATTYEYQLRLRALWQLPGRSSDRLRQAMHDWCQDARQSGVEALAEFAEQLQRAQQRQPLQAPVR
ncbi:aminotransferase [Marinobacterium nitratireducens]|uniref:Aminotransferase n=1 Tax=Marinobacterium nitratireducens TaxID=518897 RepID=A0A917ZD20_9GAMM|nr:fatty acid desaturase [Marinobacterium nitratireducens]GGO80242.1 aminotransferase [Marinobacterium nitratireducens]